MNNEKVGNNSFPSYNDFKFIRELVYDTVRVCSVSMIRIQLIYWYSTGIWSCFLKSKLTQKVI